MADKSPSDIVLEALASLEQPTTPSEIVRYARKKYPHIDEGRIRSQVTICCVNMPTRVSFPENQTPRLANDPSLDCIYRIDFGQYVKYDPALHEQWEIAEVEGELAVRKVVNSPSSAAPEHVLQEEVPHAPPSAKIHGKAKLVELAEPASDEMSRRKQKDSTAPKMDAHSSQPVETQAADNMPQGDMEMNLEQTTQLHQILADRLHEVEEGLKAHTDRGVAPKFPVPLSPTDILAQDSKGAIVILKVFTQPPGHQFITDLLVNIGWANENLAGKEVRAIVLSPVIPDELRFAAKSIPGVKLATYEYKLVFTPVK